jgi:hypothetical protein
MTRQVAKLLRRTNTFEAPIAVFDNVEVVCLCVGGEYIN